jgi:hypothetical protein
LVHIDENGDAAGNYTILGLKSMLNNFNNGSRYGLFPIGTFITRTNDFAGISFPVSRQTYILLYHQKSSLILDLS